LRSRRKAGREAGYRHTVRLVREYLRPVEPPPRLIVEIRGLGQSFAADDRIGLQGQRGDRRGRKYILAFSLPVFGVASYALARYLLHRPEEQPGRGVAASA
jgi:hypothetical protein